MLTAVTYLGSIGLGMALVAVGLLLAPGDAGVEGDADADFDGADSDGSGTVGEGLSILSMAGIGSLLVGFGSAGYALMSLSLPALVQVPAALGGAALVFRLTAWIKRLLVRNLESGTAAGEKDLIYRPATVTIPVPPGGAGRGQVLIKQGVKTFYVTASFAGERELATGESVVITGVADGIYTVEPFKPIE